MTAAPGGKHLVSFSHSRGFQGENTGFPANTAIAKYNQTNQFNGIQRNQEIKTPAYTCRVVISRHLGYQQLHYSQQCWTSSGGSRLCWRILVTSRSLLWVASKIDYSSTPARAVAAVCSIAFWWSRSWIHACEMKMMEQNPQSSGSL